MAINNANVAGSVEQAPVNQDHSIGPTDGPPELSSTVPSREPTDSRTVLSPNARNRTILVPNGSELELELDLSV